MGSHCLGGLASGGGLRSLFGRATVRFAARLGFLNQLVRFRRPACGFALGRFARAPSSLLDSESIRFRASGGFCSRLSRFPFGCFGGFARRLLLRRFGGQPSRTLRFDRGLACCFLARLGLRFALRRFGGRTRSFSRGLAPGVGACCLDRDASGFGARCLLRGDARELGARGFLGLASSPGFGFLGLRDAGRLGLIGILRCAARRGVEGLLLALLAFSFAAGSVGFGSCSFRTRRLGLTMGFGLGFRLRLGGRVGRCELALAARIGPLARTIGQPAADHPDKQPGQQPQQRFVHEQTIRSQSNRRA